LAVQFPARHRLRNHTGRIRKINKDNGCPRKKSKAGQAVCCISLHRPWSLQHNSQGKCCLNSVWPSFSSHWIHVPCTKNMPPKFKQVRTCLKLEQDPPDWRPTVGTQNDPFLVPSCLGSPYGDLQKANLHMYKFVMTRDFLAGKLDLPICSSYVGGDLTLFPLGNVW
jgi:hypothetical protein